MHRVGRDGVDSFDIEKYRICDGDTVLFVFGEIDVRCHIVKQRDAGRGLDEIIATLGSNYINAVMRYRRKFGNLDCIVQLVVPPTDQGYNPKFPFYGSLEERIKINGLLNEGLKLYCGNNRIKVLDLTDVLSARDGQFDPRLSDGSVHCGKKAFLLVENKLLPKLNSSEVSRIRFFRLFKRTGLIFIAPRLAKSLLKINPEASDAGM